METTTADYFGALLESTTLSSVAYSQLLSAADILSDNDSSSSGESSGGHHHSTTFVDHHDSHQITFEIPSHSDLERIQHLDRFSTLLKQLGKTVYNSGAADHSDIHAVAMSADGHTITSEQISNSAVLNLADLKNSHDGLERYFQGADMHSIINYLWIGVVSALVVLSVIFILFSCYFYRKFREWKKCNKDIHAHMTSNEGYPHGTGGSTTPCDTLLSFTSSAASEAAYFQKESPPCYTIATGLPTYDEALHHQHFAFGMKFVYPGLTAVHHHAAISGNMTGAAAAPTTTHWEKQDLCNSYKEQQQQYQCQQQQHQQHHQKQQQQKQPKLKTSKSASSLFHAAATSDVYDLPPEAAASVALLGPSESSACCIDMSECGGQDALLDDSRVIVKTPPPTTTPTPTVATIAAAAATTTTPMHSIQVEEITADDSSSEKSDESVIVVVFAA